MNKAFEFNPANIVPNKEALRILLREHSENHYTYVLCKPDGSPFYVGIGQGMRMFAHIEEARNSDRTGDKIETIRYIWESGQEVLHLIDGWYSTEPWDREAELILSIGQLKHGTGPLTNAQDYAPSHKVDGVEVRKYREVQGNDIDWIPDSFKLANQSLMAGPREPKSRKSVFGKIYTILEENPGVTGNELVRLLQHVDFSKNKSAYTQSGVVCAAWAVGYIEGGYFRSDTRYIQDWSGEDDRRDA